MAEDMNYVSLIAHLSQLPPNESEHLLLQFRNARLEEDGFINEEEAALCFIPLKHQKYKDKWSQKSFLL